MNKKELEMFISSDKYNLLQDKESLILYTLKKYYYKLKNIFRKGIK
tara:strand:- start:1489 stop:1626 length:138 start_codon:yes stop_codon:yes gene_type:complete